MTNDEINEFLRNKKNISLNELKQVVFWRKENAMLKVATAKTQKEVDKYGGEHNAYYDTLHIIEKVKENSND